MSVINYQSFQDLDQIDSYYLHNTSNPVHQHQMNPQTQIWCAPSSSNHPAASVSLSTNNPNNNFQQQTYQQPFENANNNFLEIGFNKNNENECTDLISRELPQSSLEQPIVTSTKVNTKQSSIQELIVSKDDQFFYSNQDSGNDIQSAQTRSNSFQSENQICSTSTIKVTNKMTSSVTYPTVQELKQSLDQNRHSAHEIVSPHSTIKLSPYNTDTHYQATSTSSCSSASLCCPSVSQYTQINADIRGEFRSDEVFHPQPIYYPPNISHQPLNNQTPYQADSEYYSQGMGYGQEAERYSFPQKKCSTANDQNAFQMAQMEERGQQHPNKIYSLGNDKSQISNFARYYEQDYQNNINYKNTGSAQNRQYSVNNNNNHYYYDRESENISANCNPNLHPAEFQNHRYGTNMHSMPSQQNTYGFNYYNNTHNSHPVPFPTFKSGDAKMNENQMSTQPTYQNGHYNQNHYYEQNYPYASKYHSGHYDPDTFFDYECAAVEFENGSHQNENNLQHFANEQQQIQNFGNNYLIGNHNKFNHNQSFEMPQKTYSSNTAFYNALNNASLAVPSSVLNVTKIDQEVRNNFQPDFIRLPNQSQIEDNQRMPALIPTQNMNQQYIRKIPLESCNPAMTQQQSNDVQSPSETISRHRESIDTIVPTNYSQDLIVNKEIAPINFKNSKEEIILEDSQDECSSPGSGKHITVESARARAKTINIVRSPAPKKSASSLSLKLTPKNSPVPKIFKKSIDITGYQEEDEEEKEIRLKLEQVKIEKKLSIDTCSLDDDEDEEDIDEGCENDSQDNPNQQFLLMLTQNKKNVVKNIMSAFKTFVLSWGEKKAIEQIYNSANDSCEEIDDIQRKFKRYIGSKSFNHYSLRLLILHINYGPIFKFFLQKFSGEWLENSKIKDTESHQKMILFFLSCFEDIKIIDTLRRHPKKKCRFS